MTIDSLLTEKQLAQKINVSLPSIRRWRADKSGPRYIKLGSSVRYCPKDVAAWLDELKKVA